MHDTVMRHWHFVLSFFVGDDAMVRHDDGALGVSIGPVWNLSRVLTRVARGWRFRGSAFLGSGICTDSNTFSNN